MPKFKTTVTLSPDLIKWIDELVQKRIFADRSHAIEYSLTKVKELMKKGEIKF